MTEPTSVQPKHTHYVSLENGCIHPALTSPAGYEDEHTTEWRPATQAEIQRYLAGAAGADRTEAYQPVPLGIDPVRTEAATPSSLTLADDDDEGAQLGVQIVQPVAPVAPPPPAALNPAVPPAPPAPLPEG